MRDSVDQKASAGDDFATVEGDEAPEDDDVGRGLHELDATVAEEAVGPTGVEREDFVVGTGIVAGDGRVTGRAGCRCKGTAKPSSRASAGPVLLMLPGDAEGVVGLGPAPVAEGLAGIGRRCRR